MEHLGRYRIQGGRWWGGYAAGGSGFLENRKVFEVSRWFDFLNVGYTPPPLPSPPSAGHRSHAAGEI